MLSTTLMNQLCAECFEKTFSVYVSNFLLPTIFDHFWKRKEKQRVLLFRGVSRKWRTLESCVFYHDICCCLANYELDQHVCIFNTIKKYYSNSFWISFYSFLKSTSSMTLIIVLNLQSYMEYVAANYWFGWVFQYNLLKQNHQQSLVFSPLNILN